MAEQYGTADDDWLSDPTYYLEEALDVSPEEYNTLSGYHFSQSVLVAVSPDYVAPVPVDDLLSGLGGDDRLYGRLGDDTLLGGAGYDRLYGGRGDDLLDLGEDGGVAFGEDGDDTLAAADAGGRTFFGGEGSDTAAFTGAFADYAFSRLGPAPGRAERLVVAGAEVTDTLADVEFLAFGDGTVLAVSDLDAPTIPNRAPVLPASPTALATGHGEAVSIWIDDLIAGVTDPDGDWVWLLTVGDAAGGAVSRAHGMVTFDPASGFSGEGSFRYTVYDGRGGETVGVAVVSVGAPPGGAQAAPTVVAPVPAPDAQAAQVVRLYDAVLDRAPDAGGFDFWTAALRGGASLEALAGAFLGSDEYAARPGGAGGGTDLGDAGFVARLYRDALGREGDAEGAAFWEAELASGLRSRAGVLAAFAESAECVAASAPLLAAAAAVWDVG